MLTARLATVVLQSPSAVHPSGQRKLCTKARSRDMFQATTTTSASLPESTDYGGEDPRPTRCTMGISGGRSVRWCWFLARGRSPLKLRRSADGEPWQIEFQLGCDAARQSLGFMSNVNGGRRDGCSHLLLLSQTALKPAPKSAVYKDLLQTIRRGRKQTQLATARSKD